MSTIKFYTPVESVRDGWTCRYEDKFVTVGSCFSDSIGGRMRQCGMDAIVNPFGTLYNPASIAMCLNRCLDQQWITDNDLVNYEGLWHSWLHHSSFSNAEKRLCIDACNVKMQETRDRLQSGCKLIVTFGTSYVFEKVGDGMVVGNCHKLPACNFNRRLLSVSEIVNIWIPLLERLSGMGVEVLFTVSPIRHLADGAHGNQISKSTLLLAVDALSHSCGNVCYFPAYEIVLDELRDYRFYERDLVHPSDVALDCVWNHFQQSYLTVEDIAKCEQGWKESRREMHRPMRK